RDPAVVECRHRDLEAFPFRTEAGGVRHADALEEELARVLRAQAELPLDRPGLEALGVGRDEEARKPARALAARAGEHERDARPRAERDEDLRAADQPVVAVALRSGRERRRVGARAG